MTETGKLTKQYRFRERERKVFSLDPEFRDEKFVPENIVLQNG